eukprot:1434744-Pyramimonas_sp.AAC.1
MKVQGEARLKPMQRTLRSHCCGPSFKAPSLAAHHLRPILISTAVPCMYTPTGVQRKGHSNGWCRESPASSPGQHRSPHNHCVASATPSAHNAPQLGG